MRVSTSRTGRPTASAAAAASGSYSPFLAPKPPPTGTDTTRTSDSGMPSTSATALRTSNGAWVLAYSVTPPVIKLGSASVAWVSIAPWWTMGVLNTPDTTTSASASAAAALPR